MRTASMLNEWVAFQHLNTENRRREIHECVTDK